MRYTKEIFEILSRGGFLSQNSVSSATSRYFDAVEDEFDAYRAYYEGIGFLLEAGNGYYYFARREEKVALADKLERFTLWIDRLDFLKVYNGSFGPGFSFSKANILESFSSNIELKDKAAGLYPDVKTFEEKVDKLVDDLVRQGFAELENELDGLYKVTCAFRYLEELVDAITIVETEES